MSLRLSIDAEKVSFSGSVDPNSLAVGDDLSLQDQVNHVLSKMKKSDIDQQQDNNIAEGKKPANNSGSSKYPLWRSRRRLVVVALDCYDVKGAPERKMIQVMHEIFKAIKSDPQIARFTGFALMTAMPVSEVIGFLTSGKIHESEFDALICSSGSEIYYPGIHKEEHGKLHPDPDYARHIDYRWGCEGLKRTIWKLLSAQDAKGSQHEKSMDQIEEDNKSGNSHCISYIVKDPTKVAYVIIIKGITFLALTYLIFTIIWK